VAEVGKGSGAATVVLDPETGLPDLPAGHFWKVTRGGSNEMTYWSGAQIWKLDEGIWSGWKWSGSNTNYMNLLDEPKHYEVELIHLNKVIDFPAGGYRKKTRNPVEDSLLWRYRHIDPIHVYTRSEDDRDDAPLITEENLVAEATKTFLAWEKHKNNKKVLGNYPPQKAGK